MDKDLNVRAKAVKLLENVSDHLHDLGLGNGFSNTTPKAQATKEETDKLGFIKTKFYASKDTIKKVEKTTHTIRGIQHLSSASMLPINDSPASIPKPRLSIPFLPAFCLCSFPFLLLFFFLFWFPLCFSFFLFCV